MSKCSLLIFFILFYSCSEENDNFFETINFGAIETLDIITWNIENYPKENSLTTEYVSNFINSLNDVDVIALQEISNQESFFNIIPLLLEDGWEGFRSENTNNQELSFLINTEHLNILSQPYEILIDEEYYFAYRPPYVIDIEFDNHTFHIVNVHLKCCDGSEQRRAISSQYLKEYIDQNLSSDNVIVLGDFNDDITEPANQNVFINFLNDTLNYRFADLDIAEGTPDNWSFPGWPSHLDHILISNEVFNYQLNVETIKLDNYMVGGWGRYDSYVSDHRPVGINLLVSD
tara:strand:- start:4877 stop:5743 length:867 start_codon:yes stop_codon:yes gene_type:complete